ncbi:MAG: response regulator [Myxococcales bacterium]
MPGILIVDDSPTVRHFLKLGLSRLAVPCDEAADGRQALEKLAAGSYDLVFCDINMPVLGGFALLAELQRMPGHPPVVMVTTEGAIEEQRRALELGAACYLTKPVQLPALQEAARRFLPALRGTPAGKSKP